MSSARSRIRHHWRVVGLLIAVVVLAAACDYTKWDVGGENRDWWCDPTDTAINDGHGDHSPYTEEKGPLSAEHCFKLDFALTYSAQIAALFPTKAVAEANGWHWLAPAISGQGTHHVHVDYPVTTEFDPLRPTMLMYDGNDDNAPLTGMMFAVESGVNPPEGFVGNNDHWHNHHMLCFVGWPDDPFIVGDGISDSQCTARGGINIDTSDTWMVHVWLPVYQGWYATDIFNKTHPYV